MSRVLIVDGNPLAWRGSVMHAEMRTRSGLLTGCVFSALENLIQGVQATQPTAVVVVWDHGKSRWRRDLYPGYKIRRELLDANPEQTKTAKTKLTRAQVFEQIQVVQRIFSLAGVHQVSAHGVEADDVIGILASGFDCLDTYDEVVLLGGDRDLYQLVRGVVTIYDPIKKAWIDDSYVADKFGVDPSQITALKGLAGDSGDDVPGAPGIGPKRAAELLHKYGSFDGVFTEEAKKDHAKKKSFSALCDSEVQATCQRALKLVTIVNCMRLDPLSEEERLTLAQAIWSPVQNRNHMNLVGNLDLYEMRRVLSHVDLLEQPAPNYEGFEQWLPR